MSALNLVRLRFDLPRLYELGKRRGLPLADADLGYLAHCQLGELIREEPPTLFALPHLHRPPDAARAAGTGEAPRPGAVEILAYSGVPGSVLLDRAKQFATPESWEALVEGQILSKPMPERWSPGARVGFEVRACPVVRTRRMRDGSQKAKGHRELDVFLARCEAEEKPSFTLDRRTVYLEWLKDRFAALPGLALEKSELVALRRERLLRREKDGERRPHRLERPDVVFRGTLRVDDGAALDALLARGLGRHRAFGFGMVLLRPASEV